MHALGTPAHCGTPRVPTNVTRRLLYCLTAVASPTRVRGLKCTPSQLLRHWHSLGLWFGDVKGTNIVVDDSRRSQGVFAVYLIDLESYVVWSGSAVTVGGIQVRVYAVCG